MLALNRPFLPPAQPSPTHTHNRWSLKQPMLAQQRLQPPILALPGQEIREVACIMHVMIVYAGFWPDE
jgi:hypothetical protein